MKKLITTLALASIATGVFAQGQVSWANFSGLISTNSTVSPFAAPGFSQIPGGTGKIGATANGFYFTLLFTTGAVPANNNPNTAGWAQAQIATVPVIGTNFGGLVGDMQGPKGSSTMLIDNWTAGTPGSFLIVGWSANLGSTWTQVSVALAANWATALPGSTYFFGVSPISTGLPTSTPSPAYNSWAGTGAPGNAFTLFEVGAPIPEPGTMALAGLGGLALLAFRRKK